MEDLISILFDILETVLFERKQRSGEDVSGKGKAESSDQEA